MLDWLAFVRAAMTLAGAIVMGSGILLWYVRATLGKPGGARWRLRVLAMILVCAGIGLVATAGVVIGTAANAAGAGQIFAFDPSVVVIFVSQTWSGKILLAVFICAAAAFVVAAGAWLMRGRVPVSDVLVLAAADLAGLGLAVIAFASHPVALEPQWVGLGLSILHRLALGLWLGGLPALVLLVGTGTVAGETRHIAYVILERFSRIAIAAMATLLVTGTILTWYIVGNFASLIGTVYGQLLLLKLTALAGVLFIAHGLRKTLLPRLETEPTDEVVGKYATRVKIESALAVLILVFASIMADRAPPEHEDIYWFLPFRFSFKATWADPWVPPLFIGGVILFVVGLAFVGHALWSARRMPGASKQRTGLALGAFTALAGAALALPSISVKAFPGTFLTPDVDFAAESIAHGLTQFEDNCVLCHGPGGRGNGIAAIGLPVPPADLTAPHAAIHTAGDMFWWLTHGIPGSTMPAFADSMSVEDRWDVINFLQAFTLGYQGRILSSRVLPNKPWLGPPDVSVTDEIGETLRLRDYRRKSALLLVIAEGPTGRARVEELLAARNRIAKLGAKIVLVAPGPDGEALRNLASGKILLVDKDTASAAATFGLLTRSLTNAKTETARAPEQNAEFLIDRSGYLRARWLPTEDSGTDSWSDLDFLDRQLGLLAQEPLWTPPKDHDH